MDKKTENFIRENWRETTSKIMARSHEIAKELNCTVGEAKPLAWEEVVNTNFPGEHLLAVKKITDEEMAKNARAGKANQAPAPSQPPAQLSLVAAPALSKIDEIRQQIAAQIAGLELERAKLDTLEREEKERQAELQKIKRRKSEQFSGKYFAVHRQQQGDKTFWRIRTKTAGLPAALRQTQIAQFETLKEANTTAMNCEKVMHVALNHKEHL